eukprot:XP_027308242.1 uncharacterized protein LOC113842884 [Anas platyrhynchos]
MCSCSNMEAALQALCIYLWSNEAKCHFVLVSDQQRSLMSVAGTGDPLHGELHWLQMSPPKRRQAEFCGLRRMLLRLVACSWPLSFNRELSELFRAGSTAPDRPQHAPPDCCSGINVPPMPQQAGCAPCHKALGTALVRNVVPSSGWAVGQAGPHLKWLSAPCRTLSEAIECTLLVNPFQHCAGQWSTHYERGKIAPNHTRHGPQQAGR